METVQAQICEDCEKEPEDVDWGHNTFKKLWCLCCWLLEADAQDRVPLHCKHAHFHADDVHWIYERRLTGEECDKVGATWEECFRVHGTTRLEVMARAVDVKIIWMRQ